MSRKKKKKSYVVNVPEHIKRKCKGSKRYKKENRDELQKL